MSRFYVTSLSGYSETGRFATIYQVLDTRYCHELIYETPNRALAEKGAAILNGGDIDWPHGHIQRLWLGRAGVPCCKCEPCRARRAQAKRALREKRALRAAP